VRTEPFVVAAALDGAGWHPAAWRADSARPAELFGARYWIDMAGLADRGGLDFVTFEDALTVQSAAGVGFDDRTDQVRGRLDAVQIAARVAPLTERVGLVPAAVVTHTEPFHLASTLSTLDHLSDGRGGWLPRVSFDPAEAGHVNVRGVPGSPEEAWAEAADAVEVVRRLWDSWEDDAVIREVATGRFVDRDRLHSVDFEGRFFSVKGPSIVPRPPQGQPVVAAVLGPPSADSPAAGGADPAARFAAVSADVVFVAPYDADSAAAEVARVRRAEQAAGRTGPPLVVVADLVVFLGAGAAATKSRLDDLDGAPYRPDAAVFTGPAAELADLIGDWRGRGVHGVRLRPGVLTDDLPAVIIDVLPELRRRGILGPPTPGPLCRRLGLARPANRYGATRQR
jgi:alkanesulfonate monooxygenase SsuD/methylene tetrahydromethanopterin reductase-like flavin-dependent oxidoreductase (luciferase family)